MKYKAEIVIDNPDIHDILKPEIQDRNRTKEKISKRGKETIVNIESEDSVALRATLNSITKLCTVYEKMKEI